VKAFEVGDEIAVYGRPHTVTAVRQPGEAGNETPFVFVHVTLVGSEPHVFDWWQESSLRRATLGR
jgi:hypothetical protein